MTCLDLSLPPAARVAMRWEGPSETAGARAARALPACLELLEACVECLAADAARGEAEPGLAEAMLAQEGAPAPPPAELPPAVAARALRSLEEAAEALLQFLEQGAEVAAAAAGAGAQLPLLLASARALARFCAEVPVAFGPRLRALLPFLLSLRAPGGAEGAAAGGGGDTGAGAGGVGASSTPAEGVLFLLPMLVQVTAPEAGEEVGWEEQQAWLAALAQPSVLRKLAQFAAATAARCSRGTAGVEAQAADSALLFACQLLLAILWPAAEPLLRGIGGGVGQLPDAPPQLVALSRAVLPVLPPLGLLAPHRPALPQEGATPQQHVRGARLVATAAALAGAAAAGLAAAPGGPRAASLDEAEQQGLDAAPALILAGLEAAVRLLQCIPAGTDAAQPRSAAERLAEAAAAAGGDEDAASDLRAALDALLGAGLLLLGRHPPFATAAAAQPWLQELLAQPGAAQGALVGMAAVAPQQAAALEALLRALGWREA